MKFKITKEEHSKLPDHFKSEYTEQDGDFLLTIEGGEDTGALKRAKDHEKKLRKDTQEKLRLSEEKMEELQEQLDDLGDKGNKDSSEYKKLERQLEKTKTELTGERDKYKGALSRVKIDSVADSLAATMSDSPKLLAPHLKSRLRMVEEDGEMVTKILDSEGEVSALTMDELKTEFSSNKDFAAIIKGSDGSGGGASGQKGGDNGGKPLDKPDFSTASPKEIATYLKQQKEV